MKYNDNGEYKDIYIKTFDTLPVGTEVDYDGETVPEGWSEIQEYSTSEIDTGKIWIDGKKIYRQVIEVNTPNSTSNTVIATYPTNTTIINFYGKVKITASSQVLPLNFYFTNEYNVATYCTDSTTSTGNINMKVGSTSYQSQPAKIVIEYTKN